ncbi:MAG: hypothetical protein Q9216_002586 [Gyalolechia sp. 2 TL-2023]
MPCLQLKRKAESGAPGESPCKVLKIRGRKVVIDPDEDVPVKRAHPQEPPPAANGRKRERVDHRDEGNPPKRAKVGGQAKGVQAPKLTRTQHQRPSPKPVGPAPCLATAQQQGPLRAGLSFFQTIQPKGMKPIPPQGSIRTVLVRGPTAPRKAQPAGPKTVLSEGPCQVLQRNGGQIQVPEARNTPSISTAASGPQKGVETPVLVKTPPVGSAKRKAKEQIEEPPAKQRAVAKAKPLSWLYTGRLKPTTVHKRFLPVKPKTTTARANCSERVKKSSTGPKAKIADPDTCKVVIDSNGGIEKVSATEERTSSDGVPPPGLENLGNSCFANSMLQALYSIKEFRNHFVSKICHCTGITHDQSLGLGLGRLFQRMQAAVRDGAKASLRDFLRAFGSRYHEYDGSKQQEAYEFLDKLFRELEAEEANSDGPAAPDSSLAKELFTGQTATRLECGACGRVRETANTDTCWSIRLDVPDGSRNATIADCFKRSLDAEIPEGFACESCGEKNVTSKTEVIKNWGMYLLLNCDRANRRGKIGTKIPIPRYVALDEHMQDCWPSTTEQGKRMAKIFPDFRYEVVAFVEHCGATYVVQASSVKEAITQQPYVVRTTNGSAATTAQYHKWIGKRICKPQRQQSSY